MSNVIWVDENDNVLGEITREKAHREGILHRVVVIYVVNDKGEIVVNERAKGEHLLDHSSTGHVDVGENYLDAAERELEEELGIAGVELNEIGYAQAQDKKENIYDCKHMFKVYVCNATPQRLKEDEVKSVFWANPKRVYEDMQVNPEKYTGGFTSTLKLFLSTQK